MGEEGSVKINIPGRHPTAVRWCSTEPRCGSFQNANMSARKKSKLLPIGPQPFMVATTQKLDRNFLSFQICPRNSFQRWEVTEASLWFGHGLRQYVGVLGQEGCTSESRFYHLRMTLLKSLDLSNPQCPSFWNGLIMFTSMFSWEGERFWLWQTIASVPCQTEQKCQSRCHGSVPQRSLIFCHFVSQKCSQRGRLISSWCLQALLTKTEGGIPGIWQETR